MELLRAGFVTNRRLLLSASDALGVSVTLASSLINRLLTLLFLTMVALDVDLQVRESRIVTGGRAQLSSFAGNSRNSRATPNASRNCSTRWKRSSKASFRRSSSAQLEPRRTHEV
jgi:hypothetical protein